jgi:hypothetical protein
LEIETRSTKLHCLGNRSARRYGLVVIGTNVLLLLLLLLLMLLMVMMLMKKASEKLRPSDLSVIKTLEKDPSKVRNRQVLKL